MTSHVNKAEALIGDVAEVEEPSEPEYTHHADSTGISICVFYSVF